MCVRARVSARATVSRRLAVKVAAIDSFDIMLDHLANKILYVSMDRQSRVFENESQDGCGSTAHESRRTLKVVLLSQPRSRSAFEASPHR